MLLQHILFTKTKPMKNVILSFSLLAFLACGNQKVSSNASTASNDNPPAEQQKMKKEKSPLLAEGNMSVEKLRTLSWYAGSYNGYQPNEAYVKSFKKALQNHDYQIDVYMGTWCHDSRRVVPKLIKILEMTGSDFSNLAIVAVNGRKVIPNVSPEVSQKLNIRYVPTIIFYENGKETGRFVEIARESLAKDLSKIASGAAYQPSHSR